MEKRFDRLLASFAMFLVMSATAFAQTSGVDLGGLQLKPGSSQIQQVLIVCDKAGVRFSVIGGSEKGVKYIDVYAGDKMLGHSECAGSKQCRITGGVPAAQLPGDVITVSVQDSADAIQREKVRISPVIGDSKVYLVSSVPDLAGFTSIPIVGSTVTETSETNTVTKPTPNTNLIEPKGPEVKGPDMIVAVKKNAENDFTIDISTSCPTGVNFIELLENGEFLDVQICENKTDCAFTKTLKKRKPGKNSYIVKTMGTKGGLSHKEETLEFTQ